MNSKGYLPQIDILKAIMIIFVILMHSLPLNLLNKIYFNFWLGQAVPVFVIILGFNQATSFLRKIRSNQSILNRKYFIKKIIRFIFPFVLAFLVSMLIGFVIYVTKHINILRLNRYLLLGRLPLPGPGNYFIALLIQYTLTLPFFYLIYMKKPKLLSVFVISLSILSEIIRNNFSVNTRDYIFNFFRFLPGLISGFWLVNNIKKLIKNYYLYLLVLISLIYLFFYIYLMDGNWKYLYFLTFFYPLAIVIFAIDKIPKVIENNFIKNFTYIGKLSFHIFLVQVIYFSILINSKNPLVITIPVNLVSCLFLGWILYKIDKSLIRLLIKNKNAENY